MVEQLYHNPDIYRIYVPLPDNPLKYLNCYVLVSDGETLIIDTGFNRPECKQALFDGLDELQVDFAHTKLFLTHLHGDHSGLTEELTVRGVPVFMNAIDYNYLCQELASGGWQAMDRFFSAKAFQEKKLRSRKRAIRPVFILRSIHSLQQLFRTMMCSPWGMLLSDVSIHRGTHRGIPAFI